jgi:hypothetical protein
MLVLSPIPAAAARCQAPTIRDCYSDVPVLRYVQPLNGQFASSGTPPCYNAAAHPTKQQTTKLLNVL